MMISLQQTLQRHLNAAMAETDMRLGVYDTPAAVALKQLCDADPDLRAYASGAMTAANLLQQRDHSSRWCFELLRHVLGTADE
jgi:hypothetical protein